MEGPLNIERDVVKNGVRLDCMFEGYEYRPEREEVRSRRLAGFECVEIAENTGLSLEQVTDYQWQHEPCLYGWKQKGKHQWYSDRKQTTIWEYDRPKANKDHPTMKPIGLMSYPIRNSTMTNGIVLDPFLGSGSTLIACEETDRVCRGIELDPKFVDVIVKRYELHMKALDLLAGRKIDHTFYPVVYGLTDEDDWHDEANWYKANPSLGQTIQIQRVRDAYQEALDNPAEENVFKQLRLNMWVSSLTRFIPEHIYNLGNQPVDMNISIRWRSRSRKRLLKK